MNLSKLLQQSTKQPKAILKIVISVSIGLLVLWIFLVSRMELPSERDSVLVFSDTTAQVIDISSSLLGEASNDQPVVINNSEQPVVFQGAFTTFFVMVSVLGAVWIWVARKKKKPPVSEQEVQELSSHIIGQGIQLRIVEINEEIWILGVSPSSVNLLHKYSKDEWKPPAKIPQGEEISGSDFNSILKMLGN